MDFVEIGKKRQKIWAEKKTYKVNDQNLSDDKKNFIFWICFHTHQGHDFMCDIQNDI